MPEQIRYEDIRKGDTIRATFTRKGIKVSREGIAESVHYTFPYSNIWITPNGGYLAYDKPNHNWKGYTLTLVDRPRPPLPTVAGSIILASKINNLGFATPKILVLGYDDYWHTLIPEYTFKPERVLEWEHAKIIPTKEETK